MADKLFENNQVTMMGEIVLQNLNSATRYMVRDSIE